MYFISNIIKTSITTEMAHIYLLMYAVDSLLSFCVHLTIDHAHRSSSIYVFNLFEKIHLQIGITSSHQNVKISTTVKQYFFKQVLQYFSKINCYLAINTNKVCHCFNLKIKPKIHQSMLYYLMVFNMDIWRANQSHPII